MGLRATDRAGWSESFEKRKIIVGFGLLGRFVITVRKVLISVDTCACVHNLMTYTYKSVLCINRVLVLKLYTVLCIKESTV